MDILLLYVDLYIVSEFRQEKWTIDNTITILETRNESSRS